MSFMSARAITAAAMTRAFMSGDVDATKTLISDTRFVPFLTLPAALLIAQVPDLAYAA